MNVFCGAVNRQRTPVSETFFDSRAFNAFPTNFFSGGCTNNVLLCYSDNGASEKTFYHCSQSKVTVIGTVDIYNANEVCDLLDVSQAEVHSGDLSLIAAAYQKWGIDCVKYFNGDFAFAIWDERTQTIVCAVDPFRQRPFYYFLDEEQFLFSNRIELLSTFPFARALNHLWIADYLSQIRTDNDATIYQNITRISPGYVLLVTADTNRYYRYWEVSAVTPINRSLKDSVDGFEWHMERAVRARVSNLLENGIELSGGLDSNGIAAIASMHLAPGRELTAFTNALPDTQKDTLTNFGDEWDAASAMARSFGITKHIPVSRSVAGLFEMLNGALETIGYPINNFFTMSQESLYKTAASHSIGVLMSGCGGNEGVSEFASGRYVYSLLKGGSYFELVRYLSNHYGVAHGSLKALRGWAKYILNVEKKSLDKQFHADCGGSLLKDSLLSESTVRWRGQMLSLANQSMRERYCYKLNQHALFERLQAGYQYTSRYGMTYRYPLLDPQFIEFYTSIPDKWKAQDPAGRSLFRTALKGKLPAHVCNQSKRTDTGSIPFFKLELDSYYDILKQWCELLPETDPVFNFIERRKVLNIKLNVEWDKVVMFRSLRCAAMLSIFLNRHFRR